MESLNIEGIIQLIAIYENVILIQKKAIIKQHQLTVSSKQNMLKRTKMKVMFIDNFPLLELIIARQYTAVSALSTDCPKKISIHLYTQI